MEWYVCEIFLVLSSRESDDAAMKKSVPSKPPLLFPGAFRKNFMLDGRVSLCLLCPSSPLSKPL